MVFALDADRNGASVDEGGSLAVGDAGVHQFGDLVDGVRLMGVDAIAGSGCHTSIDLKVRVAEQRWRQVPRRRFLAAANSASVRSPLRCRVVLTVTARHTIRVTAATWPTPWRKPQANRLRR
jgi:hypothetical protein